MTLRGEDWAYELRNRIQLDFNSFIWKLRNLILSFKGNHPLFTEGECLLLWQKAIDMVKLFYENGDYGFDEQLLIDAHFNKTRIFTTLDDPESALSELEKMLPHIASFDNYSAGLVGNLVLLPPDKWPTSLLVRPRNENDGSTGMQVTCELRDNSAMEYLKKLSDSKFDPIRNHPRFTAVVEELKKTAHE